MTNHSGEGHLKALHTIGLGMLNALKNLHILGKIHRDVKPDNFRIRPENDVVVTDFGTLSDHSQGKIGGFVGTVNYVSLATH